MIKFIKCPIGAPLGFSLMYVKRYDSSAPVSLHDIAGSKAGISVLDGESYITKECWACGVRVLQVYAGNPSDKSYNITHGRLVNV